ncbi:hypothetical protein CORC01_02740 [Colletotrichum orchidophilum]|uniref:Uncharacterized protein n=1 Tax=Colletotrichum orchidophilum TaxID=1209926 RepID=A0A1G4BK95_9PEZI|nr:uncharacterized protein CORC01_02740 [Colletotrichum orchidophilum]OHF01862.1 hypothetical protein CORC01_02740 [Colletotrichum orchidophilum]
MISQAPQFTGSPQMYEGIHQDEIVHRVPRKDVHKLLGSQLSADQAQQAQALLPDNITVMEAPWSEAGGYDIPPRENTLDSEEATPIYSILRWWYLEIGCCFLAMASLVSQAVVLWQYDGKPQDSWPSTTLTLNGLIAILATVCRATFMITVGAILSQSKWNHFSGRGKSAGYRRLDDFGLFDDASRGSWGSLQLMWRFKGAHIACVGALLTMLSLALGFFSQQLITLRVDQVRSSSPGQAGTVARSQWVNTVTGYANSWSPQTPTKLAMYEGFMSPGVSLPQVLCPTGNCTWPITPTVGVCGACVDLTAEIKINRSPSSFCIVSAPDGTQLSGYCGSGSDFMPVFNISTGSNRTFESTDTRMVKADAPNLIAQFSALGIPGGMPATTPLDDSRAAECALWYCLQAREVTVKSGELSDNIIDTWSEAAGSSTPDGRNVTFANIPAHFNTEAGKSYGMGPWQMYAMQGYAKENIIGNVSADGTLGIVFASASPYADGMHASFDDVNSWMERLTRSMTNDVRLNSNDRTDSDAFRGTVFATQVVIVVRWAWIGYAVALVSLSAIYLVVEVVRTNRSGLQPWKSDVLLPVCMDMDDEIRLKAAGGISEPGGLKRLVGDVPVQLKADRTGVVRFAKEVKTDGTNSA